MVDLWTEEDRVFLGTGVERNDLGMWPGDLVGEKYRASLFKGRNETRLVKDLCTVHASS